MMPKIIKSWEDLVGLETEKYKLEIDTEIGRGWIRPKVETEETKRKSYGYLSTHTFSSFFCKGYTELLQEFGFKVELKSWDKE